MLFRFARGNNGSVFGPLEDDIMRVVWSAKEPVSVGQVHAIVQKRGRDLAYSTIKAVLSNLSVKGYLTKEGKGKANVFAPTMSEERFREKVVNEVLDALTSDRRNPVLASLVDRIASDPGRLDELERLIAQKRNERERNG